MDKNKTLSAEMIEIYSIKYPCITRMMLQKPRDKQHTFISVEKRYKNHYQVRIEPAQI